MTIWKFNSAAIIAFLVSINLSACEHAIYYGKQTKNATAVYDPSSASSTIARSTVANNSPALSDSSNQQTDDLNNTIDKVVATNCALPAGSALLPNHLVYVKKSANPNQTAAVYNDKMALAGAVLARDLPSGAPISYADIVQIIGSAKRKTAQDILVSTKNIGAGQKLDKTNTGYWTPTPNYRPMMVQMALHDEKETADHVASNAIPKAQIITVSNTRKEATSN